MYSSYICDWFCKCGIIQGLKGLNQVFGYAVLWEQHEGTVWIEHPEGNDSSSS